MRHLQLLASLVAMTACADYGILFPTGEPDETMIAGDAIRRDYELRDDFYQSSWMLAPGGITRVAVLLDTHADATERVVLMEAQGQRPDGTTTAWLPVEVVWQEGASRVGRTQLGLIADAARIRVAAEDVDVIRLLNWGVSVPEETDDDPNDAIRVGPAVQQQGLEGFLSAIGVRPKADWNPHPRGCTPSRESTKSVVTIHHSAMAWAKPAGDFAGGIRAVQALHIFGRGWCDIAYHLVVTGDGQLWEGRGVGWRGGHVKYQNANNLGILLHGCFDRPYCSQFSGLGPVVPPDVMIESGSDLLRTAAANYGIPINASKVLAHRDWPTASTSCPGSELYPRMQDIRDLANGSGTPCMIIDSGADVLDDSGPCFERYGPDAYWRQVSGQGYGGSLMWTNAFESSSPSNWARWRLFPARAGAYRVDVNMVADYAIYPATRYVVRADGVDHEVIFNQAGGTGWRALGTFDFADSGLQTVSVYDNDGGSVASDQHIAVDALRLVPVNSCDPVPELCNGKDDDCDGIVPDDEIDHDGDGVPACAGDCAPLDKSRYPGATEVCNGLDDDCDGALFPEELAGDTSACEAKEEEDDDEEQEDDPDGVGGDDEIEGPTADLSSPPADGTLVAGASCQATQANPILFTLGVLPRLRRRRRSTRR